MNNIIFSLVFLLSLVNLSAQNNPYEQEWIQLFNGRNLTGWDIKIAGYEPNENFGNTFRVENGLMKVSYDQHETFGNRFGNIFYSQKFSHYVVRVEYRFVGDQVAEGPGWAFRNSGIMVHSQSAQSMPKDQNFPISIEVQLLGGPGSGERPNANLCTPGTNVEIDGKLFTQHCLNSSSKTYHGDQWVEVSVLVLGDSEIKHLVEGETVLAYQKPQIGGGSVSGHDESLKQDGKLLEEGYIALQSESHPIEFRKVELLNLKGCMDPKAANYKIYHVEPDNSLCKYDR